jgi:tetratricopeptide (TPR) repeat protein
VSRIVLGAGFLLLAVPAVAAPPPGRAAAQTASRPALEAAAAALQKGDFAAAEQQLRTILAQGAGPATLAVRQLLARTLLAQKREADAIAELRRAALVGPLERDLALTLAKGEQAAGHPVQAAVQLRSVASRFQSAQAWLQLASLQSEQRDARGALASLEKARALAPSSEEVLHAYATAALAAKAPLAAIPVLESLTRLAPSAAEYHQLLGTALVQAGDSAAALEPYREAVRLAPDHPDTLVALGRALNDRKLYSEAKPPLLRAQSLVPDDAAALAELAAAEEGLGELQPAEAHARRALERSPADATASLVLAALALKSERYGEARDALLAALASAPSSAKAHYQLSLAYGRLGDPLNAAAQLAAYRREMQEAEARLAKVRALTGFSPGGMQH